MFLSLHAATSVIGHSHLDAGTFVLDMQGIRWAEDLGYDDYNLPGYWDATARFNYYRTRPEGHNTLVINPSIDDYGQDLNAFTKVTTFSSQSNAVYSIADLSTAYVKNVTSLLRGYRLTDNRGAVEIRDEMNLKTPNSQIYWFMHFKDDITYSINGNTVTLTKNGKSTRIEYITNGTNDTVSVVDATPLSTSPNPVGQNLNIGYKKIQIKLTGSGQVNLTVKI